MGVAAGRICFAISKIRSTAHVENVATARGIYLPKCREVTLSIHEGAMDERKY